MKDCLKQCEHCIVESEAIMKTMYLDILLTEKKMKFPLSLILQVVFVSTVPDCKLASTKSMMSLAEDTALIRISLIC